MRNRGHRAGLLLATSFIAWASAVEVGETIAYSYDSLGRLVRVERSGTASGRVDSQYRYDPADNRTNVTVTAPAPASAPPPPPAPAAPAPATAAGPGPGHSVADGDD